MSKSVPFRVVVDTKNLALYQGGISHWFAPLLSSWIESRTDVTFLLIGPDFDTGFLPQTGNWNHMPLSWPDGLPRPLRHPWYDNVTFPRAVSRLRPDLVMSPYHDVRMPKGIPSIITVHDLCLDELGSVYPRRIRHYYLALLRRNLHQAVLVVTVSETSRAKLIERYGLDPARISVVYNTPPSVFRTVTDTDAVAAFRKRYCSKGSLLFYPGGAEYRKNVGRLLQAFERLARQDEDLILLVTGRASPAWDALLGVLPDASQRRFAFAGRLSDAELCLAYAAADAVVYPSLCEGFGRVCLEAMEMGTPIACSDLPVMREVAGEYAHYVDPYHVESIVEGIKVALSQGHHAPTRDARFQDAAVKDGFLDVMDRCVSGIDDQRETQ